jgi:hypothetical protein
MKRDLLFVAERQIQFAGNDALPLEEFSSHSSTTGIFKKNE